VRLAAAILGLSVVLAGCTAVPFVPTTPVDASGPVASATAIPGRADQVVALVGTVGALRPVRLAPDGAMQALEDSGLPLDAAWLSGGGTSLVVTTLTGAIVLGNLTANDGVSWGPAPGTLGDSHPTRAFGSLQPAPVGPGAGQLALVEGDPGSGGPGRLVVATLAGTLMTQHDLVSPTESAPAWLPDGRIVLVIRDQSDAPTAVIFDPRTGQQIRGPGHPANPSGTLAIDGQTLAELAPDGSARVGSVQDWLDGSPGELITGTGPDEPILQAQPSNAGDELALVVADAAGDAASIRILSGSGGWHEIARFEIPTGANRAVVSWLAVP